jgi:hypothetical protein
VWSPNLKATVDMPTDAGGQELQEDIGGEGLDRRCGVITVPSLLVAARHNGEVYCAVR